jgi:hypothetical protein
MICLICVHRGPQKWSLLKVHAFLIGEETGSIKLYAILEPFVLELAQVE